MQFHILANDPRRSISEVAYRADLHGPILRSSDHDGGLSFRAFAETLRPGHQHRDATPPATRSADDEHFANLKKYAPELYAAEMQRQAARHAPANPPAPPPTEDAEDEETREIREAFERHGLTASELAGFLPGPARETVPPDIARRNERQIVLDGYAAEEQAAMDRHLEGIR